MYINQVNSILQIPIKCSSDQKQDWLKSIEFKPTINKMHE